MLGPVCRRPIRDRLGSCVPSDLLLTGAACCPCRRPPVVLQPMMMTTRTPVRMTTRTTAMLSQTMKRRPHPGSQVSLPPCQPQP